MIDLYLTTIFMVVKTFEGLDLLDLLNHTLEPWTRIMKYKETQVREGLYCRVRGSTRRDPNNEV